MGRQYISLITAVALWILGLGLACAQNPQGTGGGHGKGGGGGPQRQPNHFRTLSPEDRQRFNNNAQRWMQMNPQERKIMRDREILRRQRIKQESENALRDSGLRLDAQKQAQFEARYFQERSRIEHVMRQELEAKRRQELPALVERLKKEFQAEQAGAAATSSPLVSPKPKN